MLNDSMSTDGAFNTKQIVNLQMAAAHLVQYCEIFGMWYVVLPSY